MKKNAKSKVLRTRSLVMSLLILVLIALLVIPQLRRDRSEESEIVSIERKNGLIYIPENSSIRKSIRVETVQLDSLQMRVSAPASVEANPAQRANVYPPASGRIVRLLAAMGQNIHAGQPLFEMYSPEMAEVQTDFINARSALAQAERELRRKEDLYERGIAPLRELEEARTHLEIALSEKEGASLKMQIMGLNKDEIGRPLTVRSPIGGRLIDLAVAPGEYITDAERILMVVADLSNVWVTARIQEKDIRFVEAGAGASARFSAYPGEVYEGQVLFISDILDEDTRTTKVRIAFDNRDLRLKPGMFADVSFQTAPAPAVVLPPQAVLQRRDHSYVYVETEPFYFQMRPVVVGEMVGDKLAVVSGLNEGELVVVHNAVLLP